MKNVSLRKFVGLGTSTLYDIISMKWETDNDINFVKVKNQVDNWYRLNVLKLLLVILRMMLWMNMLVYLQVLLFRL